MNPKAIASFIAQNIADFATIVIAMIVLVRYQSDPAPAENIAFYVSSLLAVMATLALSGFVDRVVKLRRIETTLSEIKAQNRQQAKADDFFLATELDDSFFRDAQETLICGLLLSTTARKYMAVLTERLQGGGTARVLLLDPTDTHVTHIMVSRSPGVTTPDFWTEKLNNTVNILRIIAEASQTSDAFQLGYLRFPPSFGLMIVHNKNGTSKAYVEIYHALSGEKNASFILERQRDAHWFDFFCDQFEKMWRTSRKDSDGLPSSQLP